MKVFLSACVYHIIKFLIFWIPNKYSPFTFGFQILPLFWWNSSPSFKAKNPEVGHIRLMSTPRFERSDSIKIFVRWTIIYIGCTLYFLIPKFLCQISILHHASGHLLERSILPLSNTILLRRVRNIVLHLDTCIFRILYKFRFDIFTTIIIYEEEDPKISGKVINEG